MALGGQLKIEVESPDCHTKWLTILQSTLDKLKRSRLKTVIFIRLQTSAIFFPFRSTHPVPNKSTQMPQRNQVAVTVHLCYLFLYNLVLERLKSIKWWLPPSLTATFCQISQKKMEARNTSGCTSSQLTSSLAMEIHKNEPGMAHRLQLWSRGWEMSWHSQRDSSRLFKSFPRPRKKLSSALLG